MQLAMIGLGKMGGARTERLIQRGHSGVVYDRSADAANEAANDAVALGATGSKNLRGYVADSGEGRWTVQEAIDLDVPAPDITLSLLMRLRSRQQDGFGARVIAALRNEFGGHAVKRT